MDAVEYKAYVRIEALKTAVRLRQTKVDASENMLTTIPTDPYDVIADAKKFENYIETGE